MEVALETRVIAYRPEFAHLTHSVGAGLLLSQMLHWSETLGQNNDGWFWMTIEEIYRQTGLSGRQQRPARTTLARLGLLEMRRRGAPPKLYYRLNMDKLEAATPVSKVTKRHIRTLHNVTFECDKTAHSYIRNNKEYYRDNNKERNADCAEGAEAVAAAPAPGEATPCDVVVIDGSLVELLVKEGIVAPAARQLAKDNPEECRRQLEYVPFVKNIRSTRAGYLRRAIELRFDPPPGYLKAEKQRPRVPEEVTQAERQKLTDQREALRRQVDEMRLDHPERFRQFLADYEKNKAEAMATALNPAMQRVLEKVWAGESKQLSEFKKWVDT